MTKRERLYHYRKRLHKQGTHIVWFYPHEQYVALRNRLNTIKFPFFRKIDELIKNI